MTTRMLVVLAFIGVSVASRTGMQSGMWAPNDLQLVTGALNAIMATPHLSQAQLKGAQDVAAKVKKNLAAVTEGKLKGEARKKLVGEAIAALTGLEQEWANNFKKLQAKHNASEAHFDELQHKLADELAAKEKLMAKDKDEMKVMELEKDLLEKKVKLTTLMAAKEAAEEKKAKEQDDRERQEMYGNLTAVAKSMSNAEAKKDALSLLKAKITKINDALTALDADEKAKEKKIEGMKTDKDAKMVKMLRSLTKKEHREFAKAKAIKTNQLDTLKEVVVSIEKGDASGVTDAVNKLQREEKMAEAHSGNFLH